MKKFEKYTMPACMIGVISYFIHTILGRILWNEYNPITTDISSLTAVGAPNRDLLMIFTNIYGITTILFISGMIIKAFRKYHIAVRVGYIILLLMNVVSLFGYSMFPLEGDKTAMSFQNKMHIIVTIIVVFTTIVSTFTLAFGYLKQEHMKKLGTFTLVMAFIITIMGMMNPISMANNINILGLTERAVVYSLQILMFVYSAYYTFNKHEKVNLQYSFITN